MDNRYTMLEFKVKQLANIKFNMIELLEYYNTLVSDYQHLKWTVPSTMNTLTHRVDSMYSWAIQSNLKDPTLPCPPYHIQDKELVDSKDTFQVPTDLIFGYGRKILDTFPNVRQTVIACHPPDTFIDQHIDTEQFVKIHVPIITNSQSYMVFGDELYNLRVGSMYMINTSYMHGVHNRGTTDRVHLIFKITLSDAQNILNLEYSL